jgi:CIC family chloride channel protein
LPIFSRIIVISPQSGLHMHPKVLALVTDLNQWRKQRISKGNFLLLAAAVVGVLGGVAASLLKQLTHFIEDSLQNDLHWKYKYYLYLFFPLLGILFTVLYIRTFIRRNKFHHGLTPILYDISRNSGKIGFHNIYSQIITSALTAGFGGSVGLEAPIVYSGSAIGSNIGRFFGLSYREVTLLLACGAGAGIAGAFNSPIAGMVFAIEILLPTFSIPAFIPLLLSVATASVVARIFYSKPLFVLVTEGWAMNALLFYVLMAVAVGFFSVYFFKLNFFLKKRFERISKTYHKVWIGGLILGLLIALFPALYGEGYITIQALLNGKYNSLLGNSFFSDYQNHPWLLVLFAVLTLFGKSLASLFTIYSGGNGGTFGPSLVMGGFIGFIFAYTVNLTGWVHLNTTNFIVVGMAAALSGIMHAPLTGIFLIAEITGGYALMVPLMIVSAIAYFINKANTGHSIYTKPLAEKGELVSHEYKDGNILRRMKLKYLVEKDFVVLHPDDTPKMRSHDIIHTDKNIFPVVDKKGVLTGIVRGEVLLECLVSPSATGHDTPVSILSEPPSGSIPIQTDMFDVMKEMDSSDQQLFPVVSDDFSYLGFVSRAGILNKYRALLRRDTDFI